MRGLFSLVFCFFFFLLYNESIEKVVNLRFPINADLPSGLSAFMIKKAIAWNLPSFISEEVSN
jgi:hypothetical protein